eukprot:TRINITY_DN642_c0_g1_i2.p1 TRINITY_DN642_c0_g1~~TRINITY_DN642_c0_g1_i2.p1  ORF type:complete len:106 (-),score=15.04 TRINITY_DN642_c0_g1_i2:100-417(-)
MCSRRGDIQNQERDDEWMRRMPDCGEEDLALPSDHTFKVSQSCERYPRSQARGRHWKHLKQIIQGENGQLGPTNEPTYGTVDAPPALYPARKYCDITGFEVHAFQ